jgi:monofunctional biosynthetic peptidoglycan transglycosylase
MRLSPRRWILFALVVGLSTPVVVLLGLPWPWVLRWVDPPATSFMLYREREAARAGRDLPIVQEWVDLADIPESVVRAVLVSEDDRFRQHHGVDWKALADEVHWSGDDDFSWWSAADRAALWKAIGYYRTHRSEIKGRSTLTQQLAKNLYFTPERSLLRKAEELVVARRLERFLSKDRILELYLNTAELGPGIFGVGAAAEEYFGVPVRELGRAQAASLAATLPQPLTSNPAHRPGRMAWRRDLILDRLAGRDVVIPDEPPRVELPPPSLDVGVSLDSPAVALPVPDTTQLDTVPPPDTTSPDTASAGRARDTIPAPGAR